MAHWTEDLHDLCEKITDELSEANKKLEKNGGKLTAGDVEYIDKLTHALKSIKTTLAMEEYSEEDGYSGARGRGQGARRDSRGRYSGDSYMQDSSRSYDRASYGGYSSDGYGRGYSREGAREDMVRRLKDLEMSAPDEESRRMVQRWIKQADQG